MNAMDKRKPIGEIISAVAKRTGVPENEMRGRSRCAPITKARHIAFYIARKEGHSWKSIGDVFNVDHTSVIHGFNRINGGISG
jgi:chromosomal replication initiation ATPase DnaA